METIGKNPHFSSSTRRPTPKWRVEVPSIVVNIPWAVYVRGNEKSLNG